MAELSGSLGMVPVRPPPSSEPHVQVSEAWQRIVLDDKNDFNNVDGPLVALLWHVQIHVIVLRLGV